MIVYFGGVIHEKKNKSIWIQDFRFRKIEKNLNWASRSIEYSPGPIIYAPSSAKFASGTIRYLSGTVK